MTKAHKIINGVAFHCHPNGGGLVAETATVADSAWVGPNARVFGRAIVRDNTTVCGHAMVCGHAIVRDNATVEGTSRVYDYAVICDDAKIKGASRVYEHAIACEYASMCGGELCGNFISFEECDIGYHTHDEFRIDFHRHPNGGGLVAETASVHPDAYIESGAIIFDHTKIDSNARIRKGTKIFGKKVIYIRPTHRTRKPSRKSARKEARKEAIRKRHESLFGW
jgi:UDP-3-O-[3-hydroxymyristoyl] glucosamine N-acyltransferase